jgi:tRNA-Thr(GGU) m(6)t(6)A37 methyltransferase TsaA
MAEKLLIGIEPIGTVTRALGDKSILNLLDDFVRGLQGLKPGASIDVLYWMHDLSRKDREILEVHPRGDRTRPRQGVFTLRSPMRPNPIGVTRVKVIAVEGALVTVTGLDAKDGSPIIDIKGASRR